jgi:mannose-6-phosphate isomerase-like protein (cupin superfamily)
MSEEDPKKETKTIRSQRPWGDIYMVVRNERCSVDVTEVQAGERSSLHSHAARYELFHFLDDGAHLELDGEVYSPKAHEEFMIYPGVKHRFWAGASGFRMLVICFGQWKAEDQERHDDDYGRKGKKLQL